MPVGLEIGDRNPVDQDGDEPQFAALVGNTSRLGHRSSPSIENKKDGCAVSFITPMKTKKYSSKVSALRQ
jgi:hypothetical protein